MTILAVFKEKSKFAEVFRRFVELLQQHIGLRWRQLLLLLIHPTAIGPLPAALPIKAVTHRLILPQLAHNYTLCFILLQILLGCQFVTFVDHCIVLLLIRMQLQLLKS